MKKMISSFGDSLLSREQMKSVEGGRRDSDDIGCVICSSGPNGGGACGTATFAADTAFAFAHELNGRFDGYAYTVRC